MTVRAILLSALVLGTLAACCAPPERPRAGVSGISSSGGEGARGPVEEVAEAEQEPALHQATSPARRTGPIPRADDPNRRWSL